MLTYSFNQLLAFFFGRKTVFTAYEGHNLGYSTGRLHVRLKWTVYKRWGGFFRGFLTRKGLPEVRMSFNPGLPPFLFEAACASDEVPELVQIHHSDLEGLDDLDDLDAITETRLTNWSCHTVIRTAEDIMELHHFLEGTQSTLLGDDGDCDAAFTEDEIDLAGSILSSLTEGLSECQLNS